MPAAANNSEAVKGVTDAMRDTTWAQEYTKGKDYYGKSSDVEALLQTAWNALYDAKQIMLGNHLPPK